MFREDRTVRQYQMLLASGLNPDVDIENSAAVFSHLKREVRELGQANVWRVQNPFSVPPINAIEDEVADVFIMLCFFCSSMGIDFESAIKNRIIRNIQKGKFGAPASFR